MLPAQGHLDGVLTARRHEVLGSPSPVGTRGSADHQVTRVLWDNRASAAAMCRSDTGPVLLLSQACRSRRTRRHAGPRWGHTGPGVGPALTERIAHVVERPVPKSVELTRPADRLLSMEQGGGCARR